MACVADVQHRHDRVDVMLQCVMQSIRSASCVRGPLYMNRRPGAFDTMHSTGLANCGQNGTCLTFGADLACLQVCCKR